MNTAISALVSFHTAVCSGQTQGNAGIAYMNEDGRCVVAADTRGGCVLTGGISGYMWNDMLTWIGKKGEFYRWACVATDLPEKPQTPNERRRYSVEEIDEMRGLVWTLLMPPCPAPWPCNYNTSREDVESQLRTYMLNGTSPQELRNKIESTRK